MLYRAIMLGLLAASNAIPTAISTVTPTSLATSISKNEAESAAYIPDNSRAMRAGADTLDKVPEAGGDTLDEVPKPLNALAAPNGAMDDEQLKMTKPPKAVEAKLLGTHNSKIQPEKMKINGIWYSRKDSMKANLGRIGTYRPNSLAGQPGRYDFQTKAPIYWLATPPPTSTQNKYWSMSLTSNAIESATGNVVAGDTIVIDSTTSHDLLMDANFTLGTDPVNTADPASGQDSIGLTLHSGLQMSSEFSAGYALQQFYFEDEGVIVDWLNADDGSIGNDWDGEVRARVKRLKNTARVVTTMWVLVGVNKRNEVSSHCVKGDVSVSASAGNFTNGGGGISGGTCDINNVLFSGQTIMAYQTSMIDYDKNSVAHGLKTKAPGY